MMLQVKKLDQNSKLPTRASHNAAGYDLYLPTDIEIGPKELKKIPLGFAIAIPDGYAGRILPRSSLATRYRVTTDAGLIDSDYRGELVLVLKNESEIIQSFSKHTRVAQMIIIPVATFQVLECSELNDTVRGSGGFGSTGLSSAVNS